MLLALVPTAQAQSTSVTLFGFPSGGKLVSETDVNVTTEGQIVVSFHGDAEAGCAAYGLCPYSGTIVVRPRSGDFGLAVYRVHGRLEREASLELQVAPGQYYTASNVERSIPGQPPGMCADAESTGLESPSTSTHGGALTIRLFSPDGTALSTRCAGPLDADVAGVGPTVTIPLRRLARGEMTVNLSGTGPFASHGFAGTVISTLALVLGRPSKTSSGPAFPPGIKTTRIRTVSEHLTLRRITGDLGATIQGDGNPLVCRLLDSCGLVGTLGVGDAASAFVGTVIARGPASRPYRDFLAALGLGAGDPRGISVSVGAYWSMGPATAELNQSGTCTDSAPGPIVFVDLLPNHGELKGSANTSSWRTRCPGPSLTDGSAPLLTAALPRHALRQRTFTIGLRPAGAIEDDGYTMSVHGHLSVVVRRGRISQSVSTTPTG